jgi:hypothetical protein
MCMPLVYTAKLLQDFHLLSVTFRVVGVNLLNCKVRIIVWEVLPRLRSDIIALNRKSRGVYVLPLWL